MAAAVLGSLLSVAAFCVAADYEAREHRNQLEREADVAVSLLQDQFARRVAVTEAVAALYSASSVVTKGSLRNHAALIASNHAGFQALLWLPKASAPMAGHGAPKDAPKDAQGDVAVADHAPFQIAAAEPVNANQAMLGIDAASFPDLRQALETAQATGHAVAAGPVSLSPDADGVQTLLVAPVRSEPSARPAAPQPMDQPQTPALRGFIATVFRADQVITDSFAHRPSSLLDVQVLGPTDDTGEGPRQATPASSADGAGATDALSIQRVAIWGQRSWRLIFQPTAAAKPALFDGRALWVLLVGLVLTASGSGYLALVARNAARLRREVEARRRAEERLVAVNERQELLLKEINHRVKNSLQLVASVFAMQARGIEDGAAKAQFTQAIGRVQAVSQVHERLYRTDDVTGIDFASYLQALCADLTASAPNHHCRVTAEPLRLPTDTAVSLGLIAAELVTNAVKHGTPPATTAGETTVDVAFGAVAHGALELAVRDYGRGVPEGFEVRTSGRSLGMRVILTLAQQLGGEVAVANARPGARWAVRLPAPGAVPTDRGETEAAPNRRPCSSDRAARGSTRKGLPHQPSHTPASR